MKSTTHDKIDCNTELEAKLLCIKDLMRFMLDVVMG